MTNVLLTIIYAIIGLVCISLSVFALRSNEQQAKVGTALFWSILGIIFIFGDWIPANIVGVLIIAMAVLSATKQVKVGSFKTSSEQFKLDSAEKIGNKLFVPALVLAVLAFVIAQFTNLGSYNAIGLSGIGALIVMFFISKSNVKEANDESIRLLSQVGPTAILPQILAAAWNIIYSCRCWRCHCRWSKSSHPRREYLVGCNCLLCWNGSVHSSYGKCFCSLFSYYSWNWGSIRLCIRC